MTPYASGVGWELWHGDALELLPRMDTGSADAVITDPPYGVDYAGWDGTVPPQEALTESLRASSGSVVWFGGAKVCSLAPTLLYQPAPDRVLIWHVTFSLRGAAANGMFYKWHPIFCWRLPKKQRALSRDVIEGATARNDGFDHPAKKPLKIMLSLVEAFSPAGGAVLDPFCGSATTGLACLQTGRRFTGIEQSEEYCEIAARRLSTALAS